MDNLVKAGLFLLGAMGLFRDCRENVPRVHDIRSPGAPAHLVKDINTRPASSLAAAFATNGKRVFIDGGGTLWSSDGTTEGTWSLGPFWIPEPACKEGRCVERLEEYAAVAGDKLYYHASDAEHGAELWASDGTPAGTGLLMDIVPGPESSQLRMIIALGDRLFFTVGNVELWATDGTQDGTVLIKDSDGFPFKSIGNRLFFICWDPSTETQALWVTDGTPDGTVFIKGDIDQYGASIVFDDMLFFSANVGTNGHALWVTDGTPEGTAPFDFQAGWFTALGDRLFFVADDGTHGSELWVMDWTSHDTWIVKDIFPGPVSSSPGGFAALGNRLLFLADDGTHGRELWVTDGTAEGTALVRDLLGQPAPWTALPPVEQDGSLLFFAQDGSGSWNLWRSDWTKEGTYLVKEVRGGPVEFFPFEGRQFFSTPGKVWSTDGTADGTVIVKEIGSGGSSPAGFAGLGDRMFFTADDGTHGSELWVTDGTSEGTVLVKDINPGSGSSSPSMGAALGNLLFFAADDGTHGGELWATDGTPGGTMLVKDIYPGTEGSYPWEFAALGNQLFFSAYDDTYDVHLWVTDGTPEGAKVFFDPGPGGDSELSLKVMDGRLYFYAGPFSSTSAFGGAALWGGIWVSDGTPEGTSLLVGGACNEIRLASFLHVHTFESSFLHTKDTLFFPAADGEHGMELWALPLSCPDQGDTHCEGLVVTGPDGGGPGSYLAAAAASDDSGDAIFYTFRAKSEGAANVLGPQADSTATFDLGAGTWTVSVDVDDGTYCPDIAVDARCSTTFDVREPGGLRRPGDANGDGGLDISDAVATLGFLFLGSPTALPCGDASASDPANLKLVDWQPDGAIDISDAIATLSFLFIGGPPHTLAIPGAGTESCVRIVGCSDACGE